MHADQISKLINDLKVLGSQEKAESLQRFFKTAKGQYGYGDIFLGLTVPLVRKMAAKYKNLEPYAIEKLLENEVHEVRLSALLIMVFKSKEFPEAMYELYIKKTRFINNWDLVDLSAPMIVGQFLVDKDCALLYKFAKSKLLWERRIAIVATYAFIKHGQSEHTLKLAEVLMNDEHDLIHKAAGWMLREVGKRCSTDVLESFLEQHAATMPRTMLRYSLEHLEPERKKYFMRAKSKK